MPRCFCQIYTHNNLTLSYTEKILDGRPVISYNKDENKVLRRQTVSPHLFTNKSSCSCWGAERLLLFMRNEIEQHYQ